MYKLKITELAQKDLQDIIDYISTNLVNPIAANNFLDEVEKCYSYLKSNPFIYSKCEDTYLAKEGFHKALINNYIVFFKIDKEKQITTIYRFIYAAREYQKLI